MAPRIMVVDDDPVIRRLVELRFRLADFDAFSTGEPAEAVRLGAASESLPLPEIAPRLLDLALTGRGAC